MDIKEEVVGLKDELILLRSDFNTHPELGFQEVRTATTVGDYLEGLGMEVRRGVGETGVVGLLKGKEEGKTVMLKADIDALPIQELNDIPYKSQNDDVKLTGTVRTLNESLHKEMPSKLDMIVKGVCEAFRGQYKLDYQAGVPVLVNDVDQAKFVKSTAEQVVGKDHVLDFPAQMGYDDMSYFLQAVPGTYYIIGSGNKAKGTDYPHHNPRFNIDEDNLSLGAEMHVKLALGFLGS